MKTWINLLILAGYAALLWSGTHAAAPVDDRRLQSGLSVTAMLRDVRDQPEAAEVMTHYFAPDTLRERVSAAAEACFSGWGDIDAFGPVTPQGGAPLSGEFERYGCVGTRPSGTAIYAVMRYVGGDRTTAEGYVITALCDDNGALLSGSNAALCEASPL